MREKFSNFTIATAHVGTLALSWWKSTFILIEYGHLFLNWYWTGPVTGHNICHWMFFPFEVIQLGLYHVLLKNLLQWVYQFADGIWHYLALILLEKYIVLTAAFSSVLSWIHVSLAVMKRLKNSSGLRLNNAKLSVKVVTRNHCFTVGYDDTLSP